MIILAVEKNNMVYAYNEQLDLCSQAQGKLHGYTCNSVAIERADCIYIYNEKGNLIAKYPYDFIDNSNIAGVIL